MEINKLSPKVLYVNTYVIYLVICKCKRPGIARTTLKNKNKIGEHMLPGFKTYKAIVIKIVWCWYKNRQINQWDRLESPEKDPYIHVMCT